MFRPLSLFAIALLTLAAGCSDSDSPTPEAAPTQTTEPVAQQEAQPDPLAIPHIEKSAPTKELQEALYRCTDGQEFTISFDDQTANIVYNDMHHSLRQQEVASGMRYTDETIEFIGKGDQAVLIVDDQTLDCSHIARKALPFHGGEEALTNESSDSFN